MKWETEVISPATYLSSTNWVHQDNNNSNKTKWTAAENKIFENALAVHDKETPDRWHKVAAMIPGKTVMDVIKQYKELEADVCDIEAGLIPVPGYITTTTTTSPFTLDWVNNNNNNNNNHGCGYDGFKQSYGINGKRSSSIRPLEQERKKGVPWTEDEHKLFLLGLKKHGKGDWRNISRNFVTTRTPTQVASHAQKYFIRQLSGGKDKRRASIHDITTVNLNEARTPSPEDNRLSPDQSTVFPHPNSGGGAVLSRSHFQWNQQQQSSNGTTTTMGFNSAATTQGNNMLMTSSSPYGYVGLKMQGHHQNNLQRVGGGGGGGSVHEAYFGIQNLGFQMQYPH